MVELMIEEDCIRCGRCVSVCPAHILTQEATQSDIKIQNLQTCIGCGQCVAICPTDSVVHSAFPSSMVHSVKKNLIPSPDGVMELLRRRRSNRTFSQKEVPDDFMDKILEAAHLAPTGGNRQSLQYTLVTNAQVLEQVTANTIKVIDRLYEEQNDKGDKTMLGYMKNLSSAYENGTDLILRGAKALILIHAANNFSTADANIAYQNASIMAESLNVGHFYTGYICIFSAQDKDGLIRKALGIEGHIYAGMALGMPKYIFEKYIDRNSMVINKIT